MSDELRRCFQNCCLFVNNKPVSESEYEAAVRKNQPNIYLPGPVEFLISCRKASGFPQSVEKSVGFYIGQGLRRAYGTMIPANEPHAVFDANNGKFLRPATAEDHRKWRKAWDEAVNSGSVR